MHTLRIDEHVNVSYVEIVLLSNLYMMYANVCLQLDDIYNITYGCPVTSNFCFNGSVRKITTSRRDDNGKYGGLHKNISGRSI